MRTVLIFMFFFNDTATTEIYTLSLHDALPICRSGQPARVATGGDWRYCYDGRDSENQRGNTMSRNPREASRSEEHTSELQSRQYLVCRLLLEKKTRPASTAPMLPTCLAIAIES